MRQVVRLESLSANVNEDFIIDAGKSIIPTGLSVSIQKDLRRRQTKSGLAAKKITVLNTPELLMLTTEVKLK